MSYPLKQFTFAERAISSMIGDGAKILIITTHAQEFKSCCEEIGGDDRVLKVDLRDQYRCVASTIKGGIIEVRFCSGTITPPRGRSYDLIVYPLGYSEEQVRMLRYRGTRTGVIPFTMIEVKKPLFSE
jgi:hypothetical protein